jgi:glycosyltransferase involved in cell wall biosynthesis
LDETPILGRDLVDSTNVAIVHLDRGADPAELERLVATFPDANVVAFDGRAEAVLAARALDHDVVLMAHDARKLTLLAFLAGARKVLLYKGGRIAEVEPARFLADRAPFVAAGQHLRRLKASAGYASVTPSHPQRFYVVSCARNAGAAALRCLDSVHAQTHPADRIEHVYLDDASTDDTRAQIRGWLGTHPNHRVTYVETAERRGGTKNTLELFRAAPLGSIVVELNGDDWFFDEGVLAHLDTIYADPSVWMTYNSSTFADGRLRHLNRPYPEATVRDASYREDDWYAGSVRTFRAELFSHVADDELVDPATGTWWESADDMVIYLALLELSGGHARHVERPTYVYNHREDSEDRRDLSGGRKRGERIRAMPRHEPLARLSSRPRDTRAGPLVSVLMPAYNAEPYVEAAIGSILDQTYDHLQLVFVDDGSTDDTHAIARRLADADGRITIVQKENAGLVAALNRGLEHTEGELIARMDADDVCAPDRLARQVEFLGRHPEVGVVGSWVERIDGAGHPLEETWETPLTGGVIGWHLFFESPLAHGAVTMRRHLIDRIGGYDPDAPHVEDFALWMRLDTITELANLPERLLSLRIHGARVGVRHREDQLRTAALLIERRAADYLRRPVPRAIASDLLRLHRCIFDAPPSDATALLDTLLDLFHAYAADRGLLPSERNAVRYDVARKLAFLARWCATSHAAVAARAAAEALRIDARALTERSARRALREARHRLPRML